MTKISIGVPTRGVQKGKHEDKRESAIAILLEYERYQNTAKRIYEKADEIDENKFKEYRIEERKVTMKSVLEVNHLTMKDLERRL